MKYQCEFPDCSYGTNTKSQINIHHIQPRECGGNNKSYNKIQLCPNHHSFIYIPEATNGIHSIKSADSIILKCWRMSSSGKILEYLEANGELKHYQRKL